MTRILITGASGFIGSYLAEEGLRRNCEIYAAVRPHSNLQYLQDERIHILPLDLSDPQKLIQKWQELKICFEAFDYVIHNAGITQAVNAADFDRVNYDCTRHLVQSLADADFRPKKFIFMSSLAAQGPGDAKTLAPIAGHQLPAPVTHYGRSKLKAEHYLVTQQDIPYLIFRPTAVYGPRDKDFLSFFKTISCHLEPYLCSRKQRLSFIYVKDLVRLLYQSLESPVVNRCFFASDGANYTSAELSSISKKALHKWTIAITFPKPLIRGIAWVNETIANFRQKTSVLNRDKYQDLTSPNWACDATQTLKAFRFQPQYTLEKGIRETIQWYKDTKRL
ncbi:MAG: NAD(P)-dependent oxidoreductase [Marinilabiliaceae bacterium]|nr:NAD(P)-dependent oxidoreductase [Marinilabiliaceae bacterium]